MKDSTKNILVIDDEPGLRRSLGYVLHSEGYNVTEAGTAQEGIQLLQAGAYDLIFLDIKLPDQSGIVLLSQIRKLYPEMPVLILTAHATMETAIEAVRQGARDYLLKPADPELIITRAKEILAERDVPQKRREITSQIQLLLNELRQYDSSAQPTPGEANAPAVDPSRYLHHGALILDLQARQVTIVNKIIPLAASAFDFLVTLVRHAPEPVAYQALVRESQGFTLTRIEACEICRWQIHELRKALEENPHKPTRIITVRDVGYRLIS